MTSMRRMIWSNVFYVHRIIVYWWTFSLEIRIILEEKLLVWLLFLFSYCLTRGPLLNNQQIISENKLLFVQAIKHLILVMHIKFILWNSNYLWNCFITFFQIKMPFDSGTPAMEHSVRILEIFWQGLSLFWTLDKTWHSSETVSLWQISSRFYYLFLNNLGLKGRQFI